MEYSNIEHYFAVSLPHDVALRSVIVSHYRHILEYMDHQQCRHIAEDNTEPISLRATISSVILKSAVHLDEALAEINCRLRSLDRANGSSAFGEQW